MAAKLVVVDPEDFISDLDVLAVSQAIQLGGITLDRDQEGTLHEYAHIVTAGLKITEYSPSMIFKIEEQLRQVKKSTVNYELRAVAAEILVLEAIGAMKDRDAFLLDLQRVSGIHKLRDRVLRRIDGRRKSIALEDAKGVVRRVRCHARRRRQLLLRIGQ